MATDLIIPDVSEYQGTINWAALAAACPAVIIRLHNGTRLDNYGPQNRAGAHTHGVQAVGLYQYLPAAVDPATAAHELCDAIGALDPGEWPILDLEEGAGDQSGRAHTWYSTVAARLHDGPEEELYSGEYFYNAHRLAAAGFSRTWLAAYGSGEPSEAHELWQFTDARTFPGVAGTNDASIFHGTVEQLLAHINPPAPTPPPAAAPALLENTMGQLPVGFGADAKGDITHPELVQLVDLGGVNTGHVGTVSLRLYCDLGTTLLRVAMRGAGGWDVLPLVDLDSTKPAVTIVPPDGATHASIARCDRSAPGKPDISANVPAGYGVTMVAK